MNQMVPQNFGPMSTRFQGQAQDNDLSAGVQAGFGLIGYKGKVWSIRYRGEERQLMRDDGDGPRNSIEIVILKAATAVSKIWYENGYTDGSHQQPDCFSTNGVTPDLASPKKQSASCASCPMNAWGSRVTPAGKAGKACSDSKRLAIAPLGDIPNEVFGGPLLLRVPAASLQDLAQFGNIMQKMGYFYNAVGVRISFDPAESYPKFQFNAIRPLTDEEADLVLEMQKSPTVDRILAEGAEHAPATQQGEQPSPNSVFEQPPQPTNGQGSTQPAQPAGPTGTTTSAAPSATSPQGTPAPHPQPTPAPAASPDGGAASATASQGFGNMAPAADPTTGQASTTSAPTQPADSTGAAGHPSPQGSGNTPSSPAPQESQSPGGGATSAATTSSGFGNVAPPANAPAAVQPEVPQEVTQPDPTAGQGSTPPAPAVATTGTPTTSPAPSTESTSQPSPAPQESQSPDGGAGTAASELEPSSSIESSETSKPATAPAGSDFEATLDEQLSKLLPS